MHLKKSFFVICLFFISFCLAGFFKTVEAEGEFKTDYNIVYTVDTNGRSHVKQDILLTNQTTRYYATKFSLSLGVTKVTNTKASDSSGSIDAVASFENNTTSIEVFLTQKVVGVGKTYNFVLEYDAPELTTKAGQIWEISIPRLADSKDIGNYDVTLEVPSIFGKAAFISPEPTNYQNNYKFSKTQLVESGVSASFGSRQVFDFTLKYHLYNQNLVPTIFEISLPPDTNYQKVIYKDVDPKPIDVSTDSDGNWIAKYQLTSRKKVDVVATGQVEIYPKPKEVIVDKLSDLDKQNYLIAQPFWDVNDQLLQKKAKELQTPFKIYQFVTDYLKYDQTRLNANVVRRLGAANAFEKPQNAVCMEFTDLFITLARAAGIPAREVNGFAYTQNERLRPLSLRSPGVDILHAWPEYWDDSAGWIAVDPTWGSTSGGIDYFTKLDFNHFAFIKKGISSQSPLPAGAYKYDQNQQGDVEVKLAQEILKSHQELLLSVEAPKTMISGLPVTIYINIENKGNSSFAKAILDIALINLKSDDPKTIAITNLPPFSKKRVEIKINSFTPFNSQDGAIKAKILDKEVYKEIKVRPAILFVLIFLAVVIFITIVLVLFVKLFIKIKRQKNDQSTTKKPL